MWLTSQCSQQFAIHSCGFGFPGKRNVLSHFVLKIYWNNKMLHHACVHLAILTFWLASRAFCSEIRWHVIGQVYNIPHINIHMVFLCFDLLWLYSQFLVGSCDLLTHVLNTLRPRQNVRHLPDDTNENVLFSIKLSLKFVPKCQINNAPAMVQIMAWRRRQAIIWTNDG